MLSDFEMIQRHFDDNHDITIIPVSDVHLGAAEHMEKEWRQFCDNVIKQPDTYITLGGDLINNGTKTGVSNVFEETMRPREQKRVMAEMLEPLKDKIICAVPGNHERRSGKDADGDPTYDIMAKLDLEHLYRENMAFVKLQMGDVRGDGRKNPTYVLCVTHGSGGGIMTGASVNRNERFGYTVDGMDCLIVGHTHKPFTTQPGKIKIDPYNNRVSVKPFKVLTATSWLEYSGYAARALMQPTTYCLQTLTLCGDHKEMIVTM